MNVRYITRALAPLAIALCATYPSNTLPAYAAESKFADVQVGELQGIVQQYSDVFGGLAGDPKTRIVHIYIDPSADPTKRSSSLAAIQTVGTTADPLFAAGDKQWTVQYVSAGPSLAILDGVMQKVAHAEPWRTDVGLKLVSYGVDPRRHAVIIDLEAITQTIRADAASTFGTLAVLELGNRVGQRYDRFQDSTPYWGGDGVVINGYGSCTAGFVAIDPSASNDRGFLTAGHCFSAAATVNQGYYDGITFHVYGTFGSVTHRDFSNGLPDAEYMDSTVVGVTTQPYVYTTTSNGYVVGMLEWPWVGESPCLDGLFTGENCTGYVDMINFCYTYIDGYTACDMARVVSGSGTLCQEGDSGGPVYQYYYPGGTTKLDATGLIEGGQVSPQECWFTQLPSALNAFGLTMATG